MAEPGFDQGAAHDAPHELLRRAVVVHFPANAALAGMVLPANLDEAWALIMTLTGMSGEELAAMVASSCGLETMQGGTQGVALAKVLPEQIARRHGIAPMAVGSEGQLVIAAASPQGTQALQEIRFAAGGRAIEVRIATPQDIEVARIGVYGGSASARPGHQVKILDLDDDAVETALAGDMQLVRFCRAMLRQAISRRASDIHIHPIGNTGSIRFRIDGRLVRAAAITPTVMAAAIRLIKAQAHMDSTNSLVPQDGRASVSFQRRRYDLRISTLPASGAEALVMRILDQSRTYDLERTNFAPWALDALRRLSANANGLVLLTGPTGSGKTSTLYSLLAALNKTTRRIITVEEPVEYQLQGLTQVEVNNAAGVTFERALRAILRQDPDILLIGEIRDAETAQIAVQAALTGHLVFSTLHSQDSLRAVPRLIDLGVPPELLADTLLGVVSQRLMRQLCPQCKTPVSDPLLPIEKLFAHVAKALPGARAVGCAHCDYTGYHGRFPVVEVLEVPDAMRSQLLRGHSDTAALSESVPPQWRSIEANAANWVISGITTPAEAFDCLGLRFWHTLARRSGVEAPVGAFLGAEAAATGLRPTVLIISTHAEISDDLRRRLLQLGETSLVVASPDEAVKALHHEHQLHLLIVDITDRSPERLEYMQQIRASVAWSGLRTLVLYDETEAGIAQRIDDFGMHSHMPVPGADNAFENLIRKLLSYG